MEPDQVVKAIEVQLDRLVEEASAPGVAAALALSPVPGHGQQDSDVVRAHVPRAAFRPGGLSFQKWLGDVLSGNYAKR